MVRVHTCIRVDKDVGDCGLASKLGKACMRDDEIVCFYVSYR